MKNKIISLITIGLLLVSCSNNEESINEDIKLLLKLEQVYKNDVVESNYKYNSDNKLVKILDSEDNIIINNVDYDNSGRLLSLNQPNGTSTNFEYLNGKLAKHTSIKNNNIISTNEYTYNNNIIVKEKVTDNFTTPSTITTYNYEYNSTTVKKINSNSPNDYIVIKYDGKKNPFSGVKYLELIIPFIHLGNEVEIQFYRNGELDYTITNTITYDSDNYPVKIKMDETSSIGNDWGEIRNYTYNK